MTHDARLADMKRQLDRCRHFTGIGHRADGTRLDWHDPSRGTCKAGVKYDDVYKSGARMIALPCFRPESDNMPKDGVWPTCPKCEFFTAEELTREAEETMSLFDQGVERVRAARAAILAACGGWDRTATKRGSIRCLVCETGLLSYSIAAINGHIHARCSTPSCVAWME
ncbi:MAG: hypothetical protein U1A27_00270 [Phycisphaerae bacterium]